ncbi:MAG: hypothetical protein ACK55I_47015, partial [bacterium]
SLASASHGEAGNGKSIFGHIFGAHVINPTVKKGFVQGQARLPEAVPGPRVRRRTRLKGGLRLNLRPTQWWPRPGPGQRLHHRWV